MSARKSGRYLDIKIPGECIRPSTGALGSDREPFAAHFE
jgi:hypothetical protein